MCLKSSVDKNPANMFMVSLVLSNSLPDIDLARDRIEQLELFHLSAQRRQGSMTGKIGFDTFANNDRLVHSDGPPVSECGNFFTGIPITFIFVHTLFWRMHATAISGEI